MTVYPEDSMRISSIKENGINLSESRSWGESWMFTAIDKDGRNMIFMYSLNNLGIRKFTSTIDLIFFNEKGKKTVEYHKEFPHKSLKIENNGTTIILDNNKLSFLPNNISLLLNNPDENFKATINTKSSSFPIKTIKTGNDSLTFMDIKDVITGDIISAKIESGNKTIDFNGRVFVNHDRTLEKIPGFIREWFTGRIMEEDFFIEFFYIKTPKKYGNKIFQYILYRDREGKLFIDNKPKMIFSNYFKNNQSGYNFPNNLIIHSIKNDFAINGEFKIRNIHFVDVLGHLSWIEKTFVKTFYTNPWIAYITYKYNISIKKNGETINKNGISVGEDDFFN